MISMLQVPLYLILYQNYIIRKNTEILIKASKDISLEVNSEKTKYMITSRHHNVVQNRNIVIGNLSFVNVEKLKYLGVTVTNTKDIREEIKRTINMGNACYYSLEKILSFRLFPKNLKLITINQLQYCIIPAALFGCET